MKIVYLGNGYYQYYLRKYIIGATLDSWHEEEEIMSLYEKRFGHPFEINLDAIKNSTIVGVLVDNHQIIEILTWRNISRWEKLQILI